MLIDELGDTPATARAFLSRLMAWGVPPTTTEGRAIARPFLLRRRISTSIWRSF